MLQKVNNPTVNDHQGHFHEKDEMKSAKLLMVQRNNYATCERLVEGDYCFDGVTEVPHFIEFV